MFKSFSAVTFSFVLGFSGLMLLGAAHSPEVAQAKASIQEAQQQKPKSKPVPTAMDAARTVCYIAGKSGMDCEVDVLNARINMTLDMKEKEAKRACPDMVRAMSEGTKLFNDRGWTLWIIHPDMKKFPKALAICGII